MTNIMHLAAVALALIPTGVVADEMRLRCSSAENLPEPPAIGVNLDEATQTISVDLGSGPVDATMLVWDDTHIMWVEVYPFLTRLSGGLNIIERATGKMLRTNISSSDFDPSMKEASRVIADAQGITTAHEFTCHRVGI